MPGRTAPPLILLGILMAVGIAPRSATAFEWEGRLSRLERDFRTGDARQRREVIRLMASYPADQVREPLLAALQDADPSVRREAADAVGRVRLREAVPILLEWLEDADADVRTAAARGLGHIGDSRPIPSLVRALGDASSDVRRSAVVALAELGDPEVVVPLLGRLDDDDPEVRIEAADALGRLENNQAVVPLVGRARDPSPEVRLAVYRALGSLGDRRASAALIQSLRDDNEGAKLAAIQALGRLGDPRAIEPLSGLVGGGDPRSAAAVVAALGSVGTPDALDEVIDALGERSVRQTASEVLATHPLDPTADEDPLTLRLAEALAETQERQHATAVASVLRRRLLRAPAPGASRALLQAVESFVGSERPDNPGEIQLRVEAAAAILPSLAATGDPEVLVPILEHLRGGDQTLTAMALEALREYFELHAPDGRAADPLLAILGRVRNEPELRVQVVRLLGEIGAPRALPAVRPLLEHTDPALRLAAVQAIGAIGDPEGADALLELLDDEDPRTRFEAAQALGATASAQIVPALLTRLEDPARFDRHAGLLALGGALSRIEPQPSTEQRAVALLRSHAEGPDEQLAARAVDALGRWGAQTATDELQALARQRAGRRRALRRHAAFRLGQLATADRQLMGRLLGDRDVAASAAVAFGEHGNAADLPRLLELIDDSPWPVPAAASFAIVRLARRGELAQTHAASICERLSGRDPNLRANLAIALSVLGASCADGVDPATWMTRVHAPAVRGATARWLAALGNTDALDRCKREELSPEVARACRAPELPAMNKEADAYAYAPDGQTILRDRLISLRFADGTVLVVLTDANGHVRLSNAPRGPVLLDDPLRTPLEP